MAETKKADSKDPKDSGSSSSMKLPSFDVGMASMYVLEHFIMLVHVFLGLVLVTSTFNLVLDSVTDREMDNLFTFADYDTTLGMIIAILVVFPLLGVFFTRVRAAEKNNAKVREKTWRSVWLNVFLAGVFVWGLTSLIGLVTELADAVLSGGLDDGGEDLWVSLLRSLFPLALAKLSWHFFYEGKRPQSPDRDRNFMMMFTGIATVLLILTAAYPLTDQRNTRIDNFIESDLAGISTKIDEYVRTENKLPKSLDDLNLDDDVEARSSDYNYEYTRSSASSFSSQYELCATFKTDTSNEEPDDFSIGFLDAVSGTLPEFGSQEFSQHSSGRDCFDLSAGGFNPFSSSSSGLDFGGFEATPDTTEADLGELFQTIQ